MIEDTVKLENQNSLLKRMNARIKTKEKNLKENKKRYWKLSAPERLHYDFRSKDIKENNSIPFFFISTLVVKVYFYFLIVFTLYKVLFQIDPTLFVKVFLNIIGLAPLLFKVSISGDILITILQVFNKKKEMKALNERYGFRKI